MPAEPNETLTEARRLEFARSEWSIPEGDIYLNHGSFGPTPQSVMEARIEFLKEQAANPMQFFLRRMEPLLDEAIAALARFLNCPPDNLIFTANSTAAMNIVAANLQLAADDEVLLTDHEYGAVVRIWGQFCKAAGARTVLARLPKPVTSQDELVDAIFASVTPRTRLLVVSHVTSPTAIIFPIKEICERARKQGVLVCVDGPHAIAMLDVDLNSIPCDFYAASCHKWLSGPLGSGFLYVKSRFKQGLRPNVVSWGRSLMGQPASWKDEFQWPGTSDPTPYLAVPAAIHLLKNYGLARFRQEMHDLCKGVRELLLTVPGTSALTPDSPEWYGTMVTIQLPIPCGNEQPHVTHPLQKFLRDKYQIEIPVIRWRDEMYVRPSCHLYNSASQYRVLKEGVSEWLAQQA